MTVIKLDLRQLKCPLPVLRTRKALKTLKAGERLEVHCTDPLAVIDIPVLIAGTGDRIETLSSDSGGAIFLIEKVG